MQQPEIKLYDLYDIWYEPLFQQRWFFISVILLVCSLLGLLVWIMYKKCHKYKPLLPWQKALQSFFHLQSPMMLQSEKSQEFYLKLCYILKEYLSERYEINLYDKTDQELIEYFQNKDILKSFAQDIERVLQGAVTIKFAKQTVVQEAMKRDLATCTTLVEKTIPISCDQGSKRI